MHLRVSKFVSVVLLVSAFALAGCESSEERAERFYQSGMKLLEAGDVDRALVEFRNVFNLNGRHKEARLAYARVQRERGAMGEAYGQYLRLVEQYPDILEARVALAEIAITGQNWDEAERHGRAARDLAPQDPTVILVNAMLDYRVAVLAKDQKAADAAIAIAETRLETEPGNLIAQRMVLDHLITGNDSEAALLEVEAAIKSHPDQIDFHMIRLQLLVKRNDTPAIDAAMEQMAAEFPKNEDVRTLLISWYLEQGNLAAAETFLRKLAEAPDADMVAQLNLLEFLRQSKGTEAAKAQLDKLIAADNNITYRAMRAAIVFEDGETAEAIAAMEAILAETTPAEGVPASDDFLNVKIALARMLLATGNEVGARARIEEVLADDPNSVEALKMKGAWLIDEDKPGDAILALRTALAQAPRDVGAISLMGQAHEREGSRELAGERYALAVDISGRSVETSLRYAAFLLADDNSEAAEAVIEEALRGAPQNIDLLTTMADVQLRKRDWDYVTRIIWQLRALDDTSASTAANAIEAEFLLRQNRFDDTLSFLQELITKGDAGSAAKAKMVQIQVRDGKIDEARNFVNAELAKTPEDPTLRFLRAGLYVLSNQPAEAETIYTALLEADPVSEPPLQALYQLLLSQGRDVEADTLLDTAIAAAPNALLPQIMKAARLEQMRDIDGAIAIYEAIYAQNSGNQIIANNLASLISTHRTDPESLDRAFAIARRLRGSDVPAFQDTYGWIEYRRGNFEDALTNLEPAAAGLPEDPLVQYHLGMTYLALDRKADAREVLTRALEIAGDNPLPQFQDAREKLKGLADN